MRGWSRRCRDGDAGRLVFRVLSWAHHRPVEKRPGYPACSSRESDGARSDYTMTSPEVANAATARPTVSVIMANYNGAVYLTQAIRSVQRQTLRDLELIVSDDASSDDSI